MYTIILSLHNITRWLVLIFGIVAVVRAFLGLLRQREWTETDRKSGILFGSFMDVQLLLGLLLYIFFSPITKTAFSNFSGAMRDSSLRFFAVEHVLIMVIAIVLTHVGSMMVKKATLAVSKHRRALVWYGVALLLVLAMIPWPSMAYGRPLLRLFGISF
jgi:hypothetical protein